MKRDMKADINRFKHWEPSALAMYLRMIDAEIRTKQHLKAAAMKAQRVQRKAQAEGGAE